MSAVVLRVVPWLADYPLHRDEAAYGYWARLIATGRDPWLLTPRVDKPPLVLYLIAGCLKIFGVSELALRLPGMVASLLTVLVAYGLARRACGARGALLASVLVAASPFAILFAPTAFTDTWLTLGLVAAAWAALAGRWFLAGLAVGLAVASKQQGLLGVPLVLLMMGCHGAERQGDGRSARCYRFLGLPLLTAVLGILVVFALVTYWDSLRWGIQPSFWVSSIASYSGLRAAPVAQWPERAIGWGEQLRHLWGLAPLSAVMLVLAGTGGIRGLRSVLGRPPGRLPSSGSPGPATCDAVAAALGLYVAGYLALHIVVTFEMYDRYLLPLVPLLAVLAARGMVEGHQRLAEAALPGQARRIIVLTATLGLAIALLYAAWLGSMGRVPVGSGPGSNAGLKHVVAILRGQPADAIIYHRWLSWYGDFYLFDAPQARRWWGEAQSLADEAARTAATQPTRPQWLAVADWERQEAEGLRPALAQQRLALVESVRTSQPNGSWSFTVYQIVPLGTARTP